jgi:acyl-CoA thioesterase-2
MSYAFAASRAVDLRAPDGAGGMRPQTPEPRLRFWIRTRRALPDDPLLHAAAFAYLSDWWLNFPAAGAHVRATAEAGRRLYVASLNHAIWWHRPLRADEWLHFDSVSPSAAAGRGLTIGRIHDRAGRLVASATQECLMVTRDE